MDFIEYFSILLFATAYLTEDQVSGEIYFKKGAPHVSLINNAVVSGSLQFSRDGPPFNSFVGIPFATIPGRFEEAQLVTGGTWKEGEIFNAVNPGALCPQATLSKTDVIDEDCLNLNVYVPMNSTGREGGYAVMVWVHGGGFMFGGGHGYGPKYFMDEDVILVTINYRLGIFGFLSTGDSVVPGNNGLKDQVLALQWVQENIRNFGGNPKKVTVFGESAGSVSVHYLLLSPTTTGLFQRAISQSGSALAPWAYNPNPGDSAKKVATNLECPTAIGNPSEITSEEILTCLKEQTIETLTAAQYNHDRWPATTMPFSFVPVKESETSLTPFITKSPWEIISDKSAPLREVPWMIGSTEDEGCTFYTGIVLSSQSLVDDLNENWASVAPLAFLYDKYSDANELPVVTEKIRKFYFAEKPVSAETNVNLTNCCGSERNYQWGIMRIEVHLLAAGGSNTNLYSDKYFLYSVYKAAVETAARGKRNPVYLYQYAHRGPASLFKLMGLPLTEEEGKKVGHGDDVLLQFNFDSLNPEPEPLIQPDSIHEQFSKNFIKLWVSFAVHGEPKHSWGVSTYTKWKRITKEEQDGILPLKWYRIDSNITTVEENLHKERMEFWDTLWTDHFLPNILPKTPTDSATPTIADKTEL